jgi:hypothetical protein
VSVSLSAVCSTRQNKFYTKETNPNNFSDRSNITSSQIGKAYFKQIKCNSERVVLEVYRMEELMVLACYHLISSFCNHLVLSRKDKLFSCHKHQ